MGPRFALVTEPASEPVSLAELKLFAKVEHSADDATLTNCIAWARKRVEHDTKRALITQEWTATLDAWPAVPEGESYRRVEFSPRPVLSIESVSVDDVEVDEDDYRFRGGAGAQFRPYIDVAADVDDSEGELTDTGVLIEFTAGYGDAEDVPGPLKRAVLLMAAHFYTLREVASPQGIYYQIAPEGYDALIQAYKVLEI